MKLLSLMKLLVTVENNMYKMKSYCLKCREFQIQVTVEKRYYQKAQHAVVKNLDLLNIKKQKDY